MPLDTASAVIAIFSVHADRPHPGRRQKLVLLFNELRAQGVNDLRDYIDEHPEFLTQAVEALEVEEVNQHILEMFGAKMPMKCVVPPPVIGSPAWTRFAVR